MTLDIAGAMQMALRAAEDVKGSTYPNPPVGAVILDAAGAVVGVGATQPVGGAHAEVMALAQAGAAAAGGTAVVTLEPCNHQGRTGPCVEALAAAGISTVVYAVADPNPQAAGGADRLRELGIGVVGGVEAQAAQQGALREWLHKQRAGRPHITWKYGASVDGRSAANDGTSQWITGEQSRADVHRRRAVAEAIIVGTGTVFADDPRLTARTPDGELALRQPLRVVVGMREVSLDANVLNDDSHTMVIRTHDPYEVVAALGDRTDVILEGGPTLAGAFLRAGLVDRILAYLAPMVLGGNVSAVQDVGVNTLSQAAAWEYDQIERLGPDVLLSLIPRPVQSAETPRTER